MPNAVLVLHRISLAIITATGCCLTATPGAWCEEEPEALLSQLDGYRMPGGSFYADVTATESGGKDGDKALAFRIYTKPAPEGEAGFLSLVALSAPAEDKGKLLLMRNNKAWFLAPSSKNPTVLSARQLWQHSFAADTLTGRLSGAYAATIAGHETIGTVDAGRVDCVVLDLSSKSRLGSTLERRRYWIGKDGRPWQLWYYAPSGAVLRKCRFAAYKDVLGNLRPTQIHVEASQGTSLFRFTNFQRADLPDALFEPGNLSSLKLTGD